MASSTEIKGSVVRQAMMDEITNRGEHMGAAMIACCLLGIGQAIQGAGSKVEAAIDRATEESGRQWGYNKPRF